MQNNQRYWLRGGLIFIILAFLSNVFVSVLVVKATCLLNNPNDIACSGLEIFKTFIKLASFYSHVEFIGLFSLMSGLLIIFFSGALGGWLYGKFKNRKNEK